jgi:hypothetical protein
MRVDGTAWMDWACWRAGAQDKGGAHVGNRSIAASCICAASSGGYLRSNMGLYRAPVRVRGMAACDAVRPPVRLRGGERRGCAARLAGALTPGTPPARPAHGRISTSPHHHSVDPIAMACHVIMALAVACI